MVPVCDNILTGACWLPLTLGEISLSLYIILIIIFILVFLHLIHIDVFLLLILTGAEELLLAVDNLVNIVVIVMVEESITVEWWKLGIFLIELVLTGVDLGQVDWLFVLECLRRIIGGSLWWVLLRGWRGSAWEELVVALNLLMILLLATGGLVAC
jgi:hypothetical protein